MRTFLYIIYIWIPVLVAIGSVTGSGLISWRHRGVINVCLSLITALIVCGALFYFYRIFYLNDHEAGIVVIFGHTHLNFIPHFAIFGAFAVFAAQAFYFLPNSGDDA